MAEYNFVPEATKAKAASKPWYKSKMIWVNGVTLVAGVVGYLAGHELIADNATLLAGLVAFQGLLNTVLRFTTWQRIG